MEFALQVPINSSLTPLLSRWIGCLTCLTHQRYLLSTIQRYDGTSSPTKCKADKINLAPCVLSSALKRSPLKSWTSKSQFELNGGITCIFISFGFVVVNKLYDFAVKKDNCLNDNLPVKDFIVKLTHFNNFRLNFLANFHFPSIVKVVPIATITDPLFRLTYFLLDGFIAVYFG